MVFLLGLAYYRYLNSAKMVWFTVGTLTASDFKKVVKEVVSFKQRHPDANTPSGHRSRWFPCPRIPVCFHDSNTKTWKKALLIHRYVRVPWFLCPRPTSTTSEPVSSEPVTSANKPVTTENTTNPTDYALYDKLFGMYKSLNAFDKDVKNPLERELKKYRNASTDEDKVTKESLNKKLKQIRKEHALMVTKIAEVSKEASEWTVNTIVAINGAPQSALDAVLLHQVSANTLREENKKGGL